MHAGTTKCISCSSPTQQTLTARLHVRSDRRGHARAAGQRGARGARQAQHGAGAPPDLHLFKSPHEDVKCLAISIMNLLAGGMPHAVAHSLDTCAPAACRESQMTCRSQSQAATALRVVHLRCLALVDGRWKHGWPEAASALLSVHFEGRRSTC